MSFVDRFIPSFLKKLDDYLLRNYPNLWVTNVHYVLFYTLILDAILFGFSWMFGFSLKDPVPEIELSFALMIVPAILVLVFWFIKQARYNVDKNFGKLSLLRDFQNYLVYFVVIFAIYTVASVIPFTLVSKVKNSITTEELMEDVKTLNQGYVYFDGYGVFSEYGEITLHRMEYVYLYDYEYGYESNDMYGSEYGETTISRGQALHEIESFIKTYNKYTYNELDYRPEEVLDDALSGYSVGIYFDDYRESVDYKLEQIYYMKESPWAIMQFEEAYLKLIFAIVGVLALITWMFKNVHWKNFLSAMLTVILSPIPMVLVGLILFELLNVSQDVEPVLGVIIAVNLAAILITIIPWVNQKYSYMGVICGMLLQLWTPFSVFIYSVMIIEVNNYYWYNWEDFLENTYWIGWGVMLLSIVIMKPYYKRMWALPKRK